MCKQCICACMHATHPVGRAQAASRKITFIASHRARADIMELCQYAPI